MVKILFIDDDPEFQEIITYFLCLEKFDVVATQKSCLAVDLAKQVQPDLILCDVDMPDMDGYGVLKALREDWDTAKIPFIFLTADSDVDSRYRAWRLGANAYLEKPVDFEALYHTIAAQLQKN